MLVYWCFLGLFAQSFAQITTPGSCGEVEGVANFNESQILGDWFDWARIDNYYQPDHACGTAVFYMNDDGYLALHYNGLIRYSGGTMAWEGKFLPRENRPTGLYDLIFPKYASERYLKGTFIATNPDHWLILHGCGEKGNEVYHFVWIFAKEYNLEQQYQEDIRSYLKSINYSVQNMKLVDQTNCPNHY